MVIKDQVKEMQLKQVFLDLMESLIIEVNFGIVQKQKDNFEANLKIKKITNLSRFNFQLSSIISNNNKSRKQNNLLQRKDLRQQQIPGLNLGIIKNLVLDLKSKRQSFRQRKNNYCPSSLTKRVKQQIAKGLMVINMLMLTLRHISHKFKDLSSRNNNKKIKQRENCKFLQQTTSRLLSRFTLIIQVHPICNRFNIKYLAKGFFTYPSNQRNQNQSDNRSTSMVSGRSSETPGRGFNQNINSLVKKQFKEDSQQFSIVSISNVNSTDQKPKVDISSTGGSNSQFLSKLRFKKVQGRNLNEQFSLQYISANQSSVGAAVGKNQYVNQGMTNSSNQSQNSYINSKRQQIQSSNTNNEDGNNSKNLFNTQDQDIQILKNSKLFNQQNIGISRNINNRILASSSSNSQQTYPNISQSPAYRSGQSVSGGSIIQKINFAEQQVQENEKIFQEQSFSFKSSQQQQQDAPKQLSRQKSGQFYNQIHLKQDSKAQANIYSSRNEKLQKNYFSTQQDHKNRDIQNSNSNKNYFNQRGNSHAIIQDYEMVNDQEEQQSSSDQNQMITQEQYEQQKLLILQQLHQNQMESIPRTKTQSIDLSYIEKSTPYLRDITLSETYIAKVGETTNEDFKDILTMINDNNK
ncbi:UNKNOWN [Stylonychia lemnae]|uniref:Uncharacterized protein n=1 Tax=Stylonychia lemnae TaxID=5949 RepID=A0A078AEB4_STYLE|nr:UNKNOWN [Stylonychia lemnae]|eukprot:CDW79842.1 UNKNOWN [Stylonychia lemnae]